MNIRTCNNLLTLITNDNNLVVIKNFITEFEKNRDNFSYVDIDYIFERFGNPLFGSHNSKLEFVFDETYQSMLRSLKIIGSENLYFNIAIKDFTFNFDDIKTFINDISDDKDKLIKLKADLEMLADYGVEIISYDDKLLSRIISKGDCVRILSDGKKILSTDKLIQFENANYLLSLKNKKKPFQKLLVKTLNFDKTLLKKHSEDLKGSC